MPTRRRGAAVLVAAFALAGCAPGTVELAPEHLGVSLQVPARWTPVEDAGYAVSLQDPDHPGRQLHADRWLAHRDFARSVSFVRHEFAEAADGPVEEHETTVGDLPAVEFRLRSPARDGAGPFDTRSVLVDLGDGTVSQVFAFAEPTDSAGLDAVATAVASLAGGDLTWPVEATPLAVGPDGLAGEFWVPREHTEPGLAVLLLGGSEGGIPQGRVALARAGYPTLALAYWTGTGGALDPALSGLPRSLREIPLEYFASALDWLAERDEVDPERIVVWGTSRGGEAALLIGASFPDRVAGVVANVPANVAVAAYPGGIGSGWSLDGEPVRHSVAFPRADAVDEPDAEIPVERIDGPVLLTCGELDTVWASCPMARAAQARLEQHGHPYPVELWAGADATHEVNRPSASLVADPREGDEAWRVALDFLADLP